ncbi:hypothetical protein NFI96_007911 [Prochilodus magdalenae]|nr:hypothetical protein NFI96_007911 [Prochilodus magdalenae]
MYRGTVSPQQGSNRDRCDHRPALRGRPQVVRVGNSFSSTLTLSTGAPQGCVLSPLLYSLFTHDCVARHTSNTIFKFADDTTILGLITDGDETAYRDEVSALSEWCYHNNLSLNISRTKEMIVDYRKLQRGGHSPLYINGAEVERVSSVRFLGVHLTDDLSWSLHTNKVVRSARQRLFFLRRLRKFGLPPDILTNFYRCTIESILTACITVWYGSCTAYDRKALKRVVRTAESIIGSKLPDLQDIYRSRCLGKIQKIRQQVRRELSKMKVRKAVVPDINRGLLRHCADQLCGIVKAISI